MILYCRRQDCGAGYGSIGEVPAICPSCGQPTRWGSSPPRAVQAPTLTLTVEDRRFLRSYKIDPS